ncbi:CCA tRNA nucleotidyltransferase [Rhizobiaceae bacterium n13]|uniref:CCA tRNA nucleotidyltransferase n=1 Tax=Ferirhizobium litorale TaxID=2927786 RepID=A0AAE3QCT5_9HYPH|nr:CCA tRNA nucleotidyltransferase [Fererhizobium litorale]MDI7860858.1 CCA tRNA nucleotidyltransferase [Fererhizobium litorale]MDI7921006.1 CCA tRNA nucleotidyltransferase [Fererhizobium litorale]
MTSIAGESWFQDPALKRVMALINHDGGEGRVVGGAVRNSLMGLPVGDIDIATTLLPQMVVDRAKTEGIKAVPTGIDHGTVTLVVDGKPFEITTLRRDVETHGRKATVAFGTDWQEDAERRDLTINALYADADGEVIDLVGGLGDVETKTVRFIGNAAERIAEDYLRILRFFRFFAHYGSGRPDADGLRASAQARGKLSTLSAERVWSELKKILSARDPGRALLWMRQAGVLTAVLPESEKWGIDAIHGLIAAEQALGWPIDPMLRLAAVIPPDEGRIDALAGRLRLSNAEAGILRDWARSPAVSEATVDAAFDRMLYRHGAGGLSMRLKHAVASSRARQAEGDAEAMVRTGRLTALLKRALDWKKPQFPLGGADIIAAGIASGPRVGELLEQLEQQWVDVNFSLDRASLLARLDQLKDG